MAYKVSPLESVFGDDMRLVRTIGRRISGLVIGLIPLKKWRKAARDRFDQWVIDQNRDKIEYFIENYPEVISEEETVRKIIAGASLARLNDGEYNLLIGIHKRAYQNLDDELVKRLREVLNSNNENMLVGIAGVRSSRHLGVVWKKFIIKKGNRTLKLFDPHRHYYSSSIAGLFERQGAEFEKSVALFKQIWEGRKVLFVVGANSRFFFVEELFDNIDRHEFVYAPAKNAFSKYDSILADIRKYDKDWLVLISLGPTAAVMAYDLAGEGYQAIDFGQIPSVYHRVKYGRRYPEGHVMQKEIDRKNKAIFK